MNDREPRRPMTPVTRIRMLLATAFGFGYVPIAPGTAGSVPGLLLAWLLVSLGGWPVLIAGTVVVAALAVWAAEGAVTHLGKKDPRLVVADEVAGQMVALWFLTPTVPVLVAAFLLFRLFDIMKPFPIRRLESLPGGVGVVADDLAAGAYTAIVVHGLVLGFPVFMGVG